MERRREEKEGREMKWRKRGTSGEKGPRTEKGRTRDKGSERG